MANTKDLTTGAPLNLLISFALPLMFGNMFQQLYTVVDTAIVGRGVGMSALAAVGTVDWLNWMFVGISQGFSQGYAVRVSQKFGQNDYEGLKTTVGISLILSLIIAAAGAVLAQLGLPLFLRLLQVPDNLYTHASTYVRIILGGFPIVMLFNFCSACLRAVGDSKTPLYAMVAASITNIVLDCITVFVLNWGIAGAAGATVFSQGLSCVICAVKLMRTPQLQFAKKHLRLNKDYIQDLMKMGTPLAVKNIIISFSGMAIQTVVNGFDMSFIAGFTATNKLYGLLEVAATSYGYAITTYVGQNYGAMRYDRIKSGMRSATSLCLVTSAVIAAVMILFGRQITMIFISAESAQQAAAAGRTAYTYLLTMAVMLPSLYLLYLYMSALQGIGNAVIPMAAGVMELIMRVSVALLVAYTGIQNGIFFAEGASWLASAALMGVYYFHSIRKLSTKEGSG